MANVYGNNELGIVSILLRPILCFLAQCSGKRRSRVHRPAPPRAINPAPAVRSYRSYQGYVQLPIVLLDRSSRSLPRVHFVASENGIRQAGVQKVSYRSDEPISSESLRSSPSASIQTSECGHGIASLILRTASLRWHWSGESLVQSRIRSLPKKVVFAMRHLEINCPVRSREVGMNFDIAVESAQRRKDLQFKICAHKLGKLLRLEAIAQLLAMIFRVLSKPILNPLANFNCLRSASALQEPERCFAVHYCPLRLWYCLE